MVPGVYAKIEGDSLLNNGDKMDDSCLIKLANIQTLYKTTTSLPFLLS